MKGKFIVFEGVDHVGKTTQLDRAQEYLLSKGLQLERYREPGGTPAGERIRELLLKRDVDDPKDEIRPKTELMLFMASRIQLLETRILPALEAGKTVLLDRYYYSTAAYQGPFLSPGYGTGWVLGMAEEWLRLLEPDLVVYLDGDPDVLVRRSSPETADRIEAKGLEYQRRVRGAYREMADYRPIFKVVDAARSIDEVWGSVKEYLDLELLFGA